MKEEPIVGYNYKINIYWPVTSTGPQLRYGNVTGKYIGLASDVFDGWVDGTEGPQYVFKTRVLEGEDEFIGEIVSVEPSSQWNVDGGRRKKRTRRRRKRKGKTRRKRRR